MACAVRLLVHDLEVPTLKMLRIALLITAFGQREMHAFFAVKSTPTPLKILVRSATTSGSGELPYLPGLQIKVVVVTPKTIWSIWRECTSVATVASCRRSVRQSHEPKQPQHSPSVSKAAGIGGLLLAGDTTTIHDQHLADYKRGVVGGQKEDRTGGLLGVANPAERAIRCAGEVVLPRHAALVPMASDQKNRNSD